MNKRIFLSVIVILLLAVGGGYMLWQKHGAPDFIDKASTNEEDGSTQEENSGETDPGRITEDQVVEDDSSEDTNSEPNNDNNDDDTSSQPAPEKPNVTRAEQSGDALRVSAIFNKQSDGTCTLQLEKSGYNNVTRTTDIITGPSYYACDGFRVPVSELPAKGQWNATVIHKANGRSTASDTHAIEVN